jgi:hypothetical protein
VGDDDDGLAKAVAQGEEQAMDFFLGSGIKVAGGLVGEEHRGLVDKGPGYGYALGLATGEFGGFMAGAIPKANFFKQAFGCFSGIFRVASGNQGGNHHVLQGGEFRQEMMELENESYFASTEGGKLPAAKR